MGWVCTFLLIVCLLISLNGVSAQEFVRGDANENGAVDFSDAIFTLNWIFKGTEGPICIDAADANDDGQIDLSDAIYTLLYLFAGGNQPTTPFPKKGFDFSEDDLNCPRVASILEIPMLKNAHCLVSFNREIPECEDFYNEECTDVSCRKELKCERFFNPVFDSKGIFYPSPCWAEELGVNEFSFGYHEKLAQFMRDLWKTPKLENRQSFFVNNPNIEYAMGSDSEVAFKSSLWQGTKQGMFNYLDYYVWVSGANGREIKQVRTFEKDVLNSVIGEHKILLAFVMFDSAYPENVLVEWTEIYEDYFNSFYRLKQEVENPLQFDIIPVVIDPPEGIGGTRHRFSNEQLELLYQSALESIGDEDIEIFAVSSVWLNGIGGSALPLNDIFFIEAPLTPRIPYSDINIEDGINSIVAFSEMLSTLSHEVDHVLGMAGHSLLGYGTNYLDWTGLDTDQVTGRSISKLVDHESICEFYSTSENHYAIDLPNQFIIRVGEEPTFWRLIKSQTGNCLSGLENNYFLKDYDLDGEYEIMYSNEMVGRELQRFLGWVDIDGDGITELVDPDNYGGFSLNEDFYCPEKASCVFEEGKCHSCSYEDLNVIISYHQGPARFNPLRDVTINGCSFKEIEIDYFDFDSGEESAIVGLVPLECQALDSEIVNVYEGVRYHWIIKESKFGKILLPRLS
jgi:hypothetical protein